MCKSSVLYLWHFFCLVEAHFSCELWWKFEHPWDARARGRCHVLYCWQVLEKGSFPHGGTLDFKWREWSIEFSGFEIFRWWGFLLGRKIWQVCFWVAWFLSRDFLGIQNNLRFVVVCAFLGCIHVVLRIKYNWTCFAFWKRLRSKMQYGFFVINFWSRDFWEFCWS